MFVPVASAMTAVHRDHLVLASNTQRYGLLHLEVKWFPLTFHNGQMDIQLQFCIYNKLFDQMYDN